MTAFWAWPLTHTRAFYLALSVALITLFISCIPDEQDSASQNIQKGQNPLPSVTSEHVTSEHAEGASLELPSEKQGTTGVAEANKPAVNTPAVNTSTAKQVSSSYIADQTFALGTVVSVKIYDSTDTSIFPKLFEYLRELESLLSRTMPDSDIYRINQTAAEALDNTRSAATLGSVATTQSGANTQSATVSVAVSPYTEELIHKALHFSKVSYGGFDPTIAPLVSLWDIGGMDARVPEPAEIAKLLGFVDYRKLVVKNGLVSLEPGMSLDLGAIAKGYIGDKMVGFLSQQGVQSALINLGGNVITMGTKPGNKPFNIGIQNPIALRNTSLGIITLSNTSIVSSGTYERYFEKDGVRYHHILDATTGYPVRNNILQVSVLSEDSVDGDGYSTALFAMGLEEGLKLALSDTRIEAAFITDSQEIYMTPGFAENFRLEDTSFTVVPLP